jgi:hypothetical protein
MAILWPGSPSKTTPGCKSIKWVPLEAATIPQAQEEFRTLLVERGEDRLRHTGRCPRFFDYVEQTYKKRLVKSP